MFKLILLLISLTPLHSHAQWANVSKRLPDIEIGLKTAPIEVIFYYSFSCLHCAEFHKESHPKLQKFYIDSGLVRLVLRDVALDEISYFASTYAHMISDKEYITLFHGAMDKQKEWLTKKNTEEHFLTTARMLGLPLHPKTTIEQNTKISDKVLTRWQDAKKKYFLNGTPAFIINGQVFNYMMKWVEFEDKLKSELKKKKAPK